MSEDAAVMVCKLELQSVTSNRQRGNGEGSDNLIFAARTYPVAEENTTWSLYTPFAELYMTVTNPDLLGALHAGTEFLVYFVPVS